MCFLWMAWISRQGGVRGPLLYPLQLSAGLPASAGKVQACLVLYGHTGKALSSSTWLNLSLRLQLREKLPPSPPSCHQEAAEGIRSLIPQQ